MSKNHIRGHMITDWNEDKIWCSTCGSRFKVLTFTGAGDKDCFEYNCPECAKDYSAESAIPPRVKLIDRRSGWQNLENN